MAGSFIASPAFAQEPGDQEPALQAAPNEEVVREEITNADTEEGLIIVTGSRIQRRNTASAAPIAVVTDEEFQLSGTVNVENVINTLPQVVPGFGSTSNNPGTGTATLNLRGLGEERSLVLVNGRRWMFYDTSQIVDLNTIPSFLLDSVDVVTGGASAVYGSDALAGVVNFRLRDVQGLELGAQVKGTQEADGFSYEVHGAFGTDFADGRGNVTVFAEYFKREAVFGGDRGFAAFAVGGNPLSQSGSSTVPYGRINFDPDIVVRPAFDADGDGEIDEDSALEQQISAPIAEGLIFDDAVFDTPGVPRARAGDLYNYAPVNYLQLPQERYLMGGYADFEIADGHSAYTEVSFVNNRVGIELAATPVTGTFDVNIDAVSQFLSNDAVEELTLIDQREAAAAAQIMAYNESLGYCGPGEEAPEGARPCAAQVAAPELGTVSTFIQRRTLETGSRNSLDERNAFRVLGGLTGPIGEYLTYDGYYMYARTRNANIQQGNISSSAFQAGLDGTADPINIFGGGTLTPEMVDQISILAQNGDISTLEVMSGSVSGTFGEFALGEAEPVAFAVGVEHRTVSSRYIPDTALASGDVIGFNAGEPTEGEYSVREAFAEINVPVELGGMRLELTGAGRYSDYSLESVGGVWTYAGGAEFVPTEGVVLRGQYQHAIRAPNVAELFAGQAIGFPAVVDPCASQTFLDANPGAAEICVATGVPQGSLGNEAIQLNDQIPALFGGNPNLQEETSDSWTAGVVLQPAFVPGLTITADYFDIVIEDAIATAGGGLQNAFDLCYGQVQDLSNPICQIFVGIRNSGGSITVDNPPLISQANIAELGVSGVDLEASYNTVLPVAFLGDTGESDLNLAFLGTWTESSYFEAIAGTGDVEECAGEFGLTCSDNANFGSPVPTFKWTSRATLVDGPLTTSVRWRHLSAVDDDDPDTEYSVERIAAYDLIDLTFAVDLMESYTLTFGVVNLFNTLPSTPEFDEDGLVINDTNSLLLGTNQAEANTYPSTYDVLGRRFFLSVAARF